MPLEVAGNTLSLKVTAAFQEQALDPVMPVCPNLFISASFNKLSPETVLSQ